MPESQANIQKDRGGLRSLAANRCGGQGPLSSSLYLELSEKTRNDLDAPHLSLLAHHNLFAPCSLARYWIQLQTN